MVVADAGYKTPAIAHRLLEDGSGSHMTKVTCSSVALSDKAKYRRIRL